MINLFEDQLTSINGVRQRFAEGANKVLLQGATGSGKSYMTTYIVSNALKKGNTCYYIVPRKELVKQISSTFDKFGLSHSYIAAGKRYKSKCKAQVVSLQSLVRRFNRVEPPSLAIIDECHFSFSTIDTVMDWLDKSGSKVIGQTATPWRQDGTGLGKHYDEMVIGPTVRELIEMKRLSDYDMYAPTQIDLSKIRKVAGEYSKADLEEFMRDNRAIVGDMVRYYKESCYGRLHIVYCVSLKHCQMVTDFFQSNGVAAAYIDGTMSNNHRKRIITDFADGKVEVLVSCDLLTFGFDLSSQVGKDVPIMSMSDAKPTMSLAQQMQKWGRVLRAKERPAIILDHAGNKIRHDLPCTEREWTLDDWKNKRGSSAEKTLPARQCDKCYYCHHPAPTCPQCGYVYPVEEREVEDVDGELEKVNKEIERKKKRQEVGMARSFDDLWAIARERGYKPGWVYKQMQIKGLR